MGEGARRMTREKNSSGWGQCHILNVLRASRIYMLQKVIVDDAALIPPSCVYKDKYRQLKMRSQGILDD